MKPSVGDRLELEISKLVHGGFGLARHDGFVVFVRGVLPGEKVRAQVGELKKSHAFADVLDVLTPSSHRVPHIWPEADLSRPPSQRAGGADYGFIERKAQLELKTDILRDSLHRFGHVEPGVIDRVQVEPVGELDGLHWRTRLTLYVDEDGRAGPYAEGTRRVIPVQSLPLATTRLEELAVHRGQWSGHATVRLVDPSVGQPRLIVDQQNPQDIEETVGDWVFHLTDQSFWQVHHDAASTLFRETTKAISTGQFDSTMEHWDLYGGVGLLGAAIIEAIGPEAKVVTVESDEVASSFAAGNLSLAPHAEAISQDVNRFVAERAQARATVPSACLGVVVLDPPRSGAKAEVVNNLCLMGPQQVIYVACDPVALGRDLATFTDHGYHATEVRGFDLFPHTHHMEAIAVLSKS